MQPHCDQPCPVDATFFNLLAGQTNSAPYEPLVVSSIGRLLILAVVVTFLILMALRGGRAMAKVVMGAAGLVFLAGVGYVMVYNVARFGGPEWGREEEAIFAEREYWGGPYDATMPMQPREYPIGPPVVAQPPVIPHVAPVAEVVTAIPSELATAPADSTFPTSGPPPAWVNRPAGLQNGVYCLPVVAGPYEQHDPEAQKALTREISKAFEQYVEMDRGADVAAATKFAPGEILRQFVKETWSEPYQSETPAMGPMVRLHALLAFDDAGRGAIDRRHAETIGGTRLLQAGGLAGALLLSLASVFGYLKLDTLTRGYYSNHLKAAAGAVIVGAIVLAVYGMRLGSIPLHKLL